MYIHIYTYVQTHSIRYDGDLTEELEDELIEHEIEHDIVDVKNRLASPGTSANGD